MKRVLDTEPVPIKLWLDDLEPGAMAQARNLANLPFVHQWVAIMPDSHQGFGMPIGGVLATRDVIIPNAVGVDIGCGMAAAETSIQAPGPDVLARLVARVREAIPTGFDHQRQPQPWEGFARAPDLPILRQELDSARHQLGTLGGGNHFIEFLADGKGCLWVMLHSGSRNFGFRAAHAYHQQARALCDRRRIELPDRDLAYLPMDEQSGQDYLAAMTYCLAFARANRARMMSVILEILHRETGATPVQELDIHHNYAALERHYGREVWVHRKGATRARAGETGIVPGSMGSPSYLVEGLGNPESFQSCAHGAGRRMGRKEAGRKLVLAEEQAKLAGILHGLRSRSDLDEAPSAYKDIDAVMENQRDLVRITTRLKPLASIKG